MKILFYKLINFFSGSQNPGEKKITNKVRETLRDYQSTLKYLERYDKGEVSKPKVLAEHRDLRSYIQSL